MDLELQVLTYIKIEQKKNGNKCGTGLTKIKLEFNLEYLEVKEILIKLLKDKKIKIKEGINEKLIFI